MQSGLVTLLVAVFQALPAGAAAREAELVELVALEPTLRLDIRYATAAIPRPPGAR